MIPLIGYADRLSARPGEPVAVKVSCANADSYRADFVEILSADPNPIGPGVRYREIESAFSSVHSAREQLSRCGSSMLAAFEVPLRLRHKWTLSVRLQPWILEAGEQVVVSVIGQPDLTLAITDRATVLRIGATDVIAVPPLARWKWHELRVVADRDVIHLQQIAIDRRVPSQSGEYHGGVASDLLIERIIFAAKGGRTPSTHGSFFNGRLEDPALIAEAVTEEKPLELEEVPRSSVLCWWDFSHGIAEEQVNDRGALAAPARLLNLPTRAVCGSRWSGKYMNWSCAPRDYAAIHFHEDDLYDCGWETDFTAMIPSSARSGIYGIRLRAGENTDVIPIFVLPPHKTAQSRLALLIPTFTYQAYANYDRGNFNADYRQRRADWNAYRYHPAEHREFGLSTYETHRDGSGAIYSSIRRPIMTCRPGFFAYVDKRGSGLRHFPADMHLVDWLHSRGLSFDVVTDHDLDTEGSELLNRYACVVTGTHPEYHTSGSLNALQEYLDRGGNIAYLGGNGFYWKIGRNPKVKDVIEVRRAEGGLRTWAMEPGEYYHALDGEYGGLWRRNRRPPQQLVGVGFSVQGLFEGTYYRRLPASYAPEMRWMFEGIEGEILGAFGLSGGGAAGFELDRADAALGTPPEAVVVARSENHPTHFTVAPEELVWDVNHSSKRSELIRADMTYFENRSGGAVFSVGSITFCGSLFDSGYDNNISRLLGNVLNRFLRPR